MTLIKNKSLPINDSADIVDFFKEAWSSNDLSKVTKATLENTEFWEKDLTKIVGLSEAVVLALTEIDANGIEKGFVAFKNKFNS